MDQSYSMALKLERDIVFLDFEATGTDPARDRIVQLAMIRLSAPNVWTRTESILR